MIDMKEWIRRAECFARKMRKLPGQVYVRVDVEPPLNQRELKELEKRLPFQLPEPLRRFYREASRKIDCRYSWKPAGIHLEAMQKVFPHQRSIYGGIRIVPASELREWKKGDVPNWKPSIPFLNIGNGDDLALDVLADSVDPPVLYLCHDGKPATRTISPDFETFLSDWERICYIGPECWLLSVWQHRRHGLLDVTRPATKKLRNLLQADEG